MLEHGIAAVVAGLHPHLSRQPGHGLEVVGEDVGLGVEHGVHVAELALEVGDEHLDGHAGRQLVAGLQGAGPDPGAPVGEVVAVDRGDHGVLEPQLGEDLGHALRLVLVHRQGAAGGHVAEATRAGADVAQDHDRERPVVPALTDVGAARALADGVELQLADPRA